MAAISNGATDIKTRQKKNHQRLLQGGGNRAYRSQQLVTGERHKTGDWSGNLKIE